MGRRRNGGDVGGGFGPHQQNRAGGVIDDKPGGLAQALRAEPLPVTVPGHDEQVRPRRGRHHGPFGPSRDLEPLAGPPEALP